MSSCIESEGSALIVRITYGDGHLEEAQLKWSEVVSAIAFKRDCFAIDILCIALGGPFGTIEINEEMTGWEQLVESTLPKKLPGCKPCHEWFPQVAFPTFQTNPLAIYTHNQGSHRDNQVS